MGVDDFDFYGFLIENNDNRFICTAFFLYNLRNLLSPWKMFEGFQSHS